MKKYLATISYVLMIVVLNVLFVQLPSFTAFGQHFAAADLLVGCIYLVRDFAQRELRHWVLAAMLVGAGLSYWLASPTVAIASLAGFLVGETIDWLIFTFSKKPLSQRLIRSSLISSPIDTVVFLWFLGQLNWVGFCVMTVGKIIGVFIVWFIWKLKADSSFARRRDATSSPEKRGDPSVVASEAQQSNP